MAKHVFWEPIPESLNDTPRAKYRALFIGIDYTGTSRKLEHAVFDAKFAENILKKTYKWKFDEVRRIYDYSSKSENIPTRNNIIAALQWLVRDSKAGDVMFLHISGHGAKTIKRNGLLPLDFEKTKTFISSKVFYEILTKQVPKSATLYADI